jgi:hypothetical protein
MRHLGAVAARAAVFSKILQTAEQVFAGHSPHPVHLAGVLRGKVTRLKSATSEPALL